MAALTEPPRFETKVEARDIRIPPSQRGRAGNPVCGRAELMGPNGWAAFTTVAHLNQRALWRDQFANRIYCREESSVAMLPMHGTPRADLRRCAWPFGSARRAPAPPEELQHASPADPPSQGHSKHRPTAQRDDLPPGPSTDIQVLPSVCFAGLISTKAPIAKNTTSPTRMCSATTQ